MRLNEKKVFESKEYIERLNNPTIWTKSILSNYISPSRTICDVLQSDSVRLWRVFSYHKVFTRQNRKAN